MYMHVSVNKILLAVFDYGNIMFTLLGVAVLIVMAQYKEWLLITSRNTTWREIPVLMVMQRKM
ncbi:hypothetical protein P6P90_12210 [Ectobacillus antri]|jgi:hypothetical protein|uniref:Uncharacterized protein n=1 Tax=Ectobacillus antri TaxID=2486280 RepID=A0ABT6H6Z8_9BACI|nr:hypothetical protein [Ectobacillus antri]MDG4657725.1 hypothetical protein [Ectobacillus antri]MDG5754732.1 hypothetical protein [Ectobacillus antri]